MELFVLFLTAALKRKKKKEVFFAFMVHVLFLRCHKDLKTSNIDSKVVRPGNCPFPHQKSAVSNIFWKWTHGNIHMYKDFKKMNAYLYLNNKSSECVVNNLIRLIALYGDSDC